MEIVVATHISRYSEIKLFLSSFSKNCIDKYDVTIRLIVPHFDIVLFGGIISQFPELNIILRPLNKLLEKYNPDNLSELQLIEILGRRTFISLKQLVGILDSHSNMICVFNSDTIFIRNFSLNRYIADNNFKHFYCSKIEKCCSLQTIQNNIIGISDNNWYHVTHMRIFDKKIVADMFQYLLNKYNNIIGIGREFIFDYCYYLYCRHHLNNSHHISWIDIYKTVEKSIPINIFSKLQKQLSEPLTIENHHKLLETNECNLSSMITIYKNLCLPIFCFTDNINVHLFILASPQITIIYGKQCVRLRQLLNTNAYNLKIAVGISGILRSDDIVNPLCDFLAPNMLDTFFYITSHNGNHIDNIYKLLKFNAPKILLVDNDSQHKNAVAKFKQPNTKESMVSNTCSMFYKKRKLLDIINTNYDIVVNIRPDLLSLDGKCLHHILLDILANYDKNTLYIPKLYNSFGITDTFAIGSFCVMKKYLQLYDNIEKYLSSYIFNPEYIVYKHCHEQHIKFSVFDWTYKIYRHPSDFLNFWWRFEFDIKNNIDEYLSLKISSFESYFTNFLPFPTNKYQITHVASKQSLYIVGNDITLSSNLHSLFTISHKNDILMRINIKYDTTLPNVNNDNSGWNLFVSPDQQNIQGRGNNDTWAQFYIIHENDYFYLITYHTHTMYNKNGTFGRYIGVLNGDIVSDLPKCPNARWYITNVK